MPLANVILEQFFDVYICSFYLGVVFLFCIRGSSSLVGGNSSTILIFFVFVVFISVVFRFWLSSISIVVLFFSFDLISNSSDVIVLLPCTVSSLFFLMSGGMFSLREVSDCSAWKDSFGFLSIILIS